MEHLQNLLISSLTITIFVFMMMVIVEYSNIFLKGRLASMIEGGFFKQSFIAGILGATPGCLGAFTNVTLYHHGLITIGAVVSGMIATSGDEAFVMLAMFPQKFLVLTIILIIVGMIVGIIVDKIKKKKFICESDECRMLVYHPKEEYLFEKGVFRTLCINMSSKNIGRWAIIVGLLAFAVSLILGGSHGHADHGGTHNLHGEWVKWIMLVAAIIATLIISLSSDHFIKDHVWKHVVKKHLPQLFLWVFGTLLLLAVLNEYVDYYSFIKSNLWWMLLLACMLGIIPQSGPNLLFVMLFSQGLIPFSILLANSIVQDGHGMLPLLAFNRRDFVLVKSINFVVGFLIGAIALLLGF